MERTPPPPGVKAYVTGPAAIVADMGNSGNRTVILITVVSLAVIFIMLLLVFRSVITAIVLLLMVGIQLQVARGIVAFLGDHEIIGLTTFVVNLLVSARDRGWNGLRDILLRAVSRGASSRRGSGNGFLHHLPRCRQGGLGLRFDDRRGDLLPQLYPAALFPTPGRPRRGGHIGRGRGGPHAGSGGYGRRQPFRLVRAQAADQSSSMAAGRHGDRSVARAHFRRDISARAYRAAGAAGIPTQLQRPEVYPQRYPRQCGI